jgi:hypothetical protein
MASEKNHANGSKSRLIDYLRSIIPNVWIAKYKKFIVHYYTCGARVEELLGNGYFSSELPVAAISDRPVLIFLARIEDGEFIHSLNFRTSARGKLEYGFLSHRDKLPTSDYVVAIGGIPAGEDGESATLRKIQSEVGCLIACIGRGLILDPITAYVADFDTERISFPSKSLSLQDKNDVVIFSASDDVEQLKRSWQYLKKELQETIELAFQSICRSVLESDATTRFVFCWTALELLTCGRPESFSERLKSHYGMHATEIEALKRKLRSREFINVRNNLVHHGIVAKLSPFGERLLQAIALDLVFARCDIRSSYALKYCEGVSDSEPISMTEKVGGIHIDMDSIPRN